MSALLEIILRGKNELSGPVKAATQDIQQLGKSTKDLDAISKGAMAYLSQALNSAGNEGAQSATKLAKATQAIDGAGRQARIGLSSAAQAADLLGTNISGVVGPAASAADAIGDITGALGAMSLSLGIITAVGLAIGFVVSQLNAISAANTQRIADISKPFEEAKKALDAIGQSDPLANLAASIGASTEKMREFAASSEEARQGLQRLNEIQKEIALGASELSHVQDVYTKITTGREELARSDFVGLIRADIEAMQLGIANADGYKNKINELNEAQLETGRTANYAAAQVAQAAQAYATAAEQADYAASAARRLAAAMGDTRSENIKGRRDDIRSLSELNTAQWFATHEFKEGVGWIEKSTEATNQANEANTKLADGGLARAAAAWNQVKSAVRGYVEQALQPTQVTLDQMNASIAGKYVPTWDEFRRRVEAIATGTDMGQFGEKFAAQLELVQKMFDGMSLDTIAAKFKDFSLFADKFKLGEMLKAGVIDLDAIIPQIESQIDQVIGKANLLSAAFDSVWSKLSGQKKIDLANALGINTEGVQNMDALKGEIEGKITNPAGEATSKVGALSGTIKGIPTSVLTTFSLKKADDFDSVFKEISEAISSIPTEVTVAVSMANNIPTGEAPPTTSSEPQGGAGGTTNGIPEFALGGYVPKTGLAFLHAGEYVLPPGHRLNDRVMGSASLSYKGPSIVLNAYGSSNKRDYSEILRMLKRELGRDWARAASMRASMRI